MKWMKQSLIALLIACLPFCVVVATALTLPSCQFVEKAAGDGVEQRVGEKIAEQLPAEKQAEFNAAWATDKKAALAVAAESLGVEKLAALITGENAALAAEIKAGGVEVLKAKGLAVGLAVAGALATWLSTRSRSKWVGIASTVIHGVQGFLESGPEGNAELMANIKTAAIANGNKAELDSVVGPVLAKIDKRPVVNPGSMPAAAPA